MNSTFAQPARVAPYDEATQALNGRWQQAPRSSKLTKVAALAVFAAVAALGAEGAWLLSHHDTAQAPLAPAAHTASPAPAPIRTSGSPAALPTGDAANDTATTGLPPVNSYPVDANGSDAPAVSPPATGAPVDTPVVPDPPAAAVPAQQGPVISVILPPPPAGNGTAGGQNGGGSGSGSGGSGSGGSGSGASGSGGSGSGTPAAGGSSKPSGIGTSHLKDQEEVRGITQSTNPPPGSSGTFGNTTANPGGTSGNSPAPGTTKFPGAAQRLFP